MRSACAASDRLACGGPQRQADRAGHARNGGVHAAQDEVADRHGLRVVEVDDLRPAAGEHVALEVARQHQQPMDLPRQDELPAFRQFGNMHRDSGIRRGIDDANDRAREIGAVEIEHADR